MNLLRQHSAVFANVFCIHSWIISFKSKSVYVYEYYLIIMNPFILYVSHFLSETLNQQNHKMLHIVKDKWGFNSLSLSYDFLPTSGIEVQAWDNITYILLNITNRAHESLCTYLSVLFALRKHELGDGKCIRFSLQWEAL